MSEAVKGTRLVYLFRVLEEGSTAATTIAFTTENTRTKSKDSDSTATKDGTIRTPGSSESEVEVTCILANDDVIIGKLEDAMDSDKIIEVWEANLDKPGTGSNKFKGIYFQGYLTEVEYSSPAEEFVEVSLSFGLNGTGVKGDVTVTASQQEAAAYVFKDTVAGA